MAAGKRLSWDGLTSGEPKADVFSIPTRPPKEALRRWREATLVLNATRRFRYTAKLAKEEDEAPTVTGAVKFKAGTHALRAVSRFIEAGKEARAKREAEVSARTSNVHVEGGYFGHDVDTLTTLVEDGKLEKLTALGGVDGVAKALRVDPEKGLPETEDDSEKRRDAFGENKYPRRPGKAFWVFVWEACQDTTLQILIACAAISIVTGLIVEPKEGWYDGAGISFAVGLVIFVTAVSDYRQALRFQSLNDEKKNLKIDVVRGGRPIKISIYDLLVGDVVPLTIGCQVPGDGLLLKGHQLQIDESSMTGESIYKHKDPTRPFLTSGCKVVDGFGTMLVTGVGMHTEWGRLMATVNEENNEETPLQVRLNGTATAIGKVGLAVASIVLVALLIRYFVDLKHQTKSEKRPSRILKELSDRFSIAVTIVVVAVPEGLPLAVTLTLAYSMKKMMEEKALVRHLAACETMGSATAICSDKTGTLTLNQMTVVKEWVSGILFGEPAEAKAIPSVSLPILLESIAFNTSGVVFVPEGGGPPEVSGSPTEVAILKWGVKLGMDFKAEKSTKEAVGVEPFNSTKKRAGVAVQTPDGKSRMHWKGASEIVLGLCTHYLDSNGTKQPLTADVLASCKQTIEDMAKASLRTICLAYTELPDSAVPPEGPARENWEMPAEQLTALAIVGIKDPPRPGVLEAVRRCQVAGVKVRMVTGDNAVTAEAIAREVGIMTANGRVIEGPAFRELTEEQMMEILPSIDVMARSSPTDKHTMVKTLRKMGQVVGVTGDGTNDAPALHEADIGLAMGIAGTEVAKESADIIILDDNFASIVNVVRWGRSVFANIQKFLQFQLTVNVVALTLNFVIALWKGSEVPLKAVQLLWVNLIMDTLGALALATEPPNDELMYRAPVGRTEPLITNIMVRNILGQAAYQLVVFFVLYVRGTDILNMHPVPKEDITKHDVDERLLTIIFNAFVFCQIFNEINSRKPEKLNVFEGLWKNHIFIGIIVLTSGFQYLIVTFGGKFAQTVPLSWRHWIICVIIGSISLPVGFIVKFIPVSEKSWLERFIRGKQAPVMVRASEADETSALAFAEQGVSNGQETSAPSGVVGATTKVASPTISV